MKPNTSSVLSRLAPLLLLLAAPTLAQPVGDLAAHRTEQEVKDSLRAALPFLEDKVASTIKDGASTPIAFHGEAQLRTQFHQYYNLPDNSYLGMARQGLMFGGDDPLLKIGMVITPGRNTVMWAKMGFTGTFQGVNQTSFLKPDENGYSSVTQHHFTNKRAGVYEDMAAGIAIRTKPASFMLKMGAMNWNESSPLSIWKAQPRMFAWEYLPYEIEQPIADYYKYNLAKGEKIGRAAWNKKPFQGIDFTVTDIPGDFNFLFMYGAGQPYDMYERNSMDMAVDLGYAGDEGGIVETGIGDSYRKHLFYRFSKKFNSAFQLGVSNGYSYTSTDIINAGFKYDFVFNSKFDVGLYNSSWNVGNETVVLKDKESYDKIVKEVGTGSLTATTVGEGYFLDPKFASVDARGTIGKFSYMADLGFSMVETTFVSISNETYEKPLTYADSSFSSLKQDADGGYTNSVHDYVRPGSIYSERKSDGMDYSDIAAFLEIEYKSKVDVGLDLLYAGKKFYSPYSFVAPVDGFFARGSNLLGAGKFLGNEASPYTSNMIGAGLTVKPNIPWYGHLKVKYGLNRQNSAGRDVLFFPYRLNGSSMVSTFNRFYSKWGLGKVSETYDFNYNQGGIGSGQEVAEHPVSRIGDESYGTYIGDKAPSGAEKYGARSIKSPTSGGMRANAHSLYEGFVPYQNAEDLIFNHFSKSSLVTQERDLSQIWQDSLRTFVDMRDSIDGIRVIEDGTSKFYTLDDNTLTVTDENGVVLETKEVSTKSSTGFVPVSTKNSFNFALDWALDIGKYIGYKNDLFLSLYYEVNGASRGFVPLAVNSSNEKTLMVSHYLRSEPAIALTKNFYILGLIGWEQWTSDKSWIREDYEGKVGFKKSKIKTTDLALGLGFDWDMMKRVGLHGRYKWYSHKDSMLPGLRYDAHSIAFELKAYF